MRVFLVGAALMLMFVSAMLFLVGERKTSGRVSSKNRFNVTGHVTGDFPGAPWAGTVAKLGAEQALIPPTGRFSFVVPPGRYAIGVCCSPEFQAIEQVVDVVDQDVELTLVARPLIDVLGKISVSGNVPSLQGFAIAASMRGTNVVGRAVSDAAGQFSLRLGPGEWQISIDNLPEGYSDPEIRQGGGPAMDNRLVIGETPATVALELHLKAAGR